jgi:hypothetical protein
LSDLALGAGPDPVLSKLTVGLEVDPYTVCANKGFVAIAEIKKLTIGLSGIEVTHCGGTTTARTESTTIIRTPPGSRELKRSRLECHIGF